MTRGPKPAVYWRETGAGPVLVLLNGWTASGQAWPRAWVRSLEARYRVVRIDNRGSGYSRFADTPFTVADMADDVAAVLDACGHESATVLGLSMGGMIAQEFALRHGSRVDALMLMATRPPAPAYVLPKVSQLGSLLTPRKRGETLSMYMTRLWSSATAKGFADREPEAIAELVAQIVARPTQQAMLAHQLRAVTGWSHAERLARIDARTFVVHGDQDVFIEPGNGKRLAKLIPGARYFELEGVGHLPPMESPGAVLDLIAELTDADDDGPRPNGHRDPGLVSPGARTWH